MSRWAMLGGLGGLALGSPALAQTAGASAAAALSIVDTPQVAQMPSHFTANGTVQTEYESNVTGGDSAVAAVRGLKLADVVTTPTLLLEGFEPLGRQSVFLTGSVGYNFFAQNTILNRESIDLTGGANGQLGSCRATATGSYIRSQDDVIDVTVTKVQDVFDTVSVGLEGTCGRGIGLAPTFSVSQSWTSNSLSELSTSDYRTLGGTAGVSYQNPTIGNLSLFGQYQTTDFENRILVVGQNPIHDGFDIYGGGVKYSRLLGARIQGTVSVSYTATRPFIGNTSGFSGVTYGADVTYRASSRLMLHGSFLRDIQPSNVFDATYFLENKELIEANYSFGSRLTLNVGASDRDRNFKGAALVRNFDLTNDEVKTIYSSITYRLRRVYFAFNLRNDQRTANIADLSYPETRAGLTVGTSF